MQPLELKCFGVSGYKYKRHLGEIAGVLGSTLCEVALEWSDRSKDSSVVCLYYCVFTGNRRSDSVCTMYSRVAAYAKQVAPSCGTP